jgi:membrane associated rhomboid family serine protease
MIYRSYRSYSLTPIWVIMILSFLAYIAILISSNFILLLGLQAATFLYRPWTIVANLFVHGSLWHLLANMLTLYFFGSFLTRLVGTGKFLIVYFGGGILGNIFYMLLASPFSIVIGASGAIFALGGVLSVLTPKLRVFVFPIPVPLPLWVALIGGFLIMSLFPHVAWQGHLGGLIFGLIAGLILRNRTRLIL